jgi:hypothetical protein
MVLPRYILMVMWNGIVTESFIEKMDQPLNVGVVLNGGTITESAFTVHPRGNSRSGLG